MTHSALWALFPERRLSLRTGAAYEPVFKAQPLAFFLFERALEGGEGDAESVGALTFPPNSGPAEMMLLYASSGAAHYLDRVLYDRENLAGNIAFQAAEDLALAQSLSGAATHVCPGAGIVTKAD